MITDSEARFVVGIDLGTTNSAVAYIDMRQEDSVAAVFPVPQLVAPGTVEARDSLPSFHYEPAKGEFENEEHPIVGVLARDHGAAVPGRLAVSAKSWLSHGGVDRKAELLPWHGADDVKKLSPCEASRRYLEHIRRAWDHARPDAPLAEQDVVLTVPASFDEVARELTVEAARNAGLPKLCLLEEPQAAFYAWMREHREADGMQAGQSILVCDIGGGTTDLTLIETEEGKHGELAYRRIAVGEHLLLGGDNLDLALAHHAEQKLGGGKLAPAVWSVLVRRCQQAKEILLGTDAPESYSIQLPARGRSVVGGSRGVELERAEALRLLVEGFLPQVAANEKPSVRQSGFQEFGLPYAPDAAITRYLTAFLAEHGDVRPDHILFNGGFFESAVLRERLLEVLEKALDWKPQVLRADRLDLAVACGAAEYGRVRRGQGTRITGGLARTYYLGIGVDHGEPSAVCLLPAGLEEGETVQLQKRTFKLRIRKPVEFPLYTSGTRTTDQPGDLLPIDEATMRPMPSIKTVINTGKKKKADTVAVQLHARLTEIGTIEVWLAEKDGNREWRLQFDARAATQTERAVEEDTANRAGVMDESMAASSAGVIKSVLGPGRTADPNGLLSQLEANTGLERSAWPPALLRRWFEEVLPLADCRKASPALEARWLNLLGYALRPGYGFAADDWRVANAWRIKQDAVANHRNEMCRAEWWILWRRMAGGLTEHQQLELANPLIKQWSSRILKPAGQKPAKLSNFQFGDHESAEVWRLLGSLERLPASKKTMLGELLLTWLERKGASISNGAAVWALGRIGARVPNHGPLNTVVPADTAENWAGRLMKLHGKKKEVAFALMHLARHTGDRYRDVSDDTRTDIVTWLNEHGASGRLTTLVRSGGLLDAEEQDQAFGEALPPGLHLAG
ncbi:Chaperone protein HscA [Pontiella desulfatans]|uniref:Chaperone protein HscA n=1 Tax=Pontiella desulfatans TaxID=2750659 RepID=A0A6C2U4F6_PONDE|nr:hsp70 family protein [Pontiella desulfatans]VGO14719.1 Chaperone protein HscA [Pontiella desulfatans]